MSYLNLRRPFLVILAVAGLGLSACSGSAGTTADTITEPQPTAAASSAGLMPPDAFNEFLQGNPDAQLINVHIPYAGHIANTDTFIAFDEILDTSELPEDKSAPIALYCRSGNMSGQAAAELAGLGYTNVADLDGGMNAWTASGRELLDDPTSTS